MRSSKHTNRFKQVVLDTPALAEAYQEGLKALGNYASKIQLGNCQALGSVYLEQAIPQARWDYGIGLQEGGQAIAIWVEIHPAHTSEVDRVIEKLKWLKDWLQNSAPALLKLTPKEDAFYWVATKGVHITPNSPQARRLAKAGLRMPRHVLELCR